MAAPLSVADALARVLDPAAPLPAETVPLAQAHGRVLAEDLAARRTQPPDDVSAMDGYAVRAADVAAPGARLRVIGEVPAGRPFDGTVGPGETARIFTGGVMPAGADTVVVQEVATRDGDTVTFSAAGTPGRHVRRRGRDFATGAVLLRRGRRLTMRDLALAAAMNHPAVPAHRRPRVGLLATGDELVPPGTEPGPGRIVYSNGFAIGALARHEGADTIDLGIVPDRLDETVAAIRRARAEAVDVLVTTGGASVGDYDLVQTALASEGMRLAFWKIAMRPGRPLMSGRLGEVHVLGLPGNPVSSFVTAVLFLVPLLRRLQGRGDLSIPDEPAIAGAALKENDERADFLRAMLSTDAEGRLVATPVTDQDSSLLAPLGLADGLLLRAPHAAPVPAGGPCRVIRLPA
ncbi:molybdopterin molybdotransferase MoeA [Rhodoplanes sp. TEM]|uniref:Molybdopterin molybdenumtransferase n=1 Tax=Rhodoplanes tepidamans TaxID=200616 RepID=A0ABT5JBJ3_RHOTP|nr:MULTISPECIES: gephyrin-like molybdotransferase Glp [Rhodoplanes]MDC7786425.1 molybdopterin molybdotransferase MoeA [Rhodoplanes tepidamans]MDC7985067.1 molybdopterin molybdotransferase MoeA [Rhodoplanes sp. TEM]MDQ0357310.1 molybdopterin molybdotransferase [Rhodoplanes tepidamans]